VANQGADTERKEDLPQGVPWSESARTAIRVLMGKRGRGVTSLKRILLPVGNKYPTLAVARQGLKGEGLKKLP
jgi:hypothetical protein